MRFYSVITRAIEDVENALKGMLAGVRGGPARDRRGPRGLPVEQVRQYRRLARAIREIRRGTKARLVRDGVVVGENIEIAGLRRFKDDVTEVREGLRVRHQPRRLQRHPDR